MNRDAYARELEIVDGYLKDAMNVLKLNNVLIFAQELQPFYEIGAKTLDQYLPTDKAAADILEEGVKTYEENNGTHTLADKAGKIMIYLTEAKNLCKRNDTEKSLEKFGDALVISEHILKESAKNGALVFTAFDR